MFHVEQDATKCNNPARLLHSIVCDDPPYPEARFPSPEAGTNLAGWFMPNFKAQTHAMVLAAWTAIGLAASHQAEILPILAAHKVLSSIFLGVCAAYYAYHNPKPGA